jgi:hypothetical protein
MNFRESITMLVIQDKKQESDNSDYDSDKSQEEQAQQPTFRALVGRKDEETEALLQQQQYLQNIHAAKTFLKMGEPRDSYGSAECSARDNLTKK